MLEKPNLPDEQIIACLQQAYGLQNIGLEFLSLGNDSSAAVYKVSTENATYFLKIKYGVIPLVTVEVPHYLAVSGIPQIVSPIRNHHNMLWTPFPESMLVLYP